MNKLILNLILSILVSPTFAQTSVTDRNACFKYYGQYIQPYLQLLHESQYKGELDTLKNSYLFLVYFKISTKGEIIDFEIDDEIAVPDLVKAYFKKIIYYSSGDWFPEIRNCTPVISQTITCQVSINKKNIFKDIYKNIELENTKHISEYFKIDKVSQFNPEEPNHCALYLTY